MLGNITSTTVYLHFLTNVTKFLLSDNPALLIIQHWRKVVHSTFHLGGKKKLHNETGKSQGHVQTDLRERLYINHAVLSPKPVSPILSTSAMKTPANTEEDPDDSEQPMKEISKWHTPLISSPHMWGVQVVRSPNFFLGNGSR